MTELKYKVGDKVKIKSLDWYNENKDEFGNVVFSSKVPHFSWYENVRTMFTKDMVKFCGKVVTIESVWTVNYSIVEGTYRDYFTDEMIEGLVEEETKPKYEDEVNGEYYSTTKYLVRPSGYQFVDENGNVINARKIVLEKKKIKYPKTYEECCKVLGYSGNYDITVTTDVDNRLFNALYKLKVCRDAYWKIAGEKMGLGKPWSPDYTEESYEQGSPIKYVIYYSGTDITKGQKCTPSYILSFPTPEMRDAFYENFKSEIEFCKELL